MAVLLEGELETINLQQYSYTAQGIKVWLAVCRKAQVMSQDEHQVPLQQKYPNGLLFVRATMILE
jgi:hypothetical protein